MEENKEDSVKKKNRKGCFVVKEGQTYFQDRQGRLFGESNLDELIENIKKKVKADSNFRYYFD